MRMGAEGGLALGSVHLATFGHRQSLALEAGLWPPQAQRCSCFCTARCRKKQPKSRLNSTCISKYDKQNKHMYIYIYICIHIYIYMYTCISTCTYCPSFGYLLLHAQIVSQVLLPRTWGLKWAERPERSAATRGRGEGRVETRDASCLSLQPCPL